MKKKTTEIKKDWYKSYYDEDLTQTTLNSERMQILAKKQILGLSKILKIKKSDKILDVPCGQGRHSMLLAKKGYSVQGIDISKTCIKLACESAKKKELDIPFGLGDMSDLKKFKGQFDVVLNLFTSFGYFPTERQNEKVMKNFVACLKPKGRLCIEILNAESLLLNLVPRGWHEDEDKYILESVTYDKRRKRINNTWTFLDKKTAKTKTYPHSLRIYTKVELESLMRKCGLSKIKVYNGFAGGKFKSKESHRILLIGEKA
jgi:2-polyprenyl-3-methyl-5-hydroxy-6-metoxy-1,4-benzoquinol methylase